MFDALRGSRLNLVLVAGSLWLCTASPAAARQGQNFHNNHINVQHLNHRMRNEVRTQRNLQEGSAVQKLFAGHQFNRVQNFNRSNHLNAIHNRSFQVNDLGQSVNFKNGVDLDFGSTMRNITLCGKLFNKVDSVTVNLGGEEKQLCAGMQVTAAEYVAVKQVLQNGQQSVSIDSSGRAVGGRIDFGSITAKNDRMRADDLSIPENVAVYGDFGKGSTFQVMGDLVNGGAIYGYSSRQIQKDGTIRADNITNLQSGTITSGIEDMATHGVAPAISGQAGNGVVNLNLHADEVLSNYGTISGAADLTVSAGSAIHNHSSITTNGNLNVLSANVSNKGLLQSNTGNVTFDTPVAAVLSINNENGIVAARNGAVNLRDTAYNGTHNTYFNGGDILSNEFNVNSGQGTADILVNQLTGVVNETGYASHVVANTENLVLGKICLTGDPTYSNTAGNITIAGNINVDENLSLIATGDITNSTPVNIIAANATQGFDIVLIAGAKISAGGGVINTVGPIAPPPPPGISTTIDGNPSATGGNVVLGTSAGGLVTISTRSNGTPGNQDGGNVLVAAFRLGAGTGLIDLIGSTINTGGFGTGKNGDIVILGGGNDLSSLNRAVKVGTLDQTGGTGTSGVVTIANKQPITIGTATFLANGTQTGGISPGGAPAGSAGIELSGNITVAGQMTFYSGDFSSIAIDPGVQINSSNLVQFNHQGASNVIAGAASNIFAPILVFSTGTGDVGTLANRLSTNAPFVDVLGSNASTDVFLFDNNPGIVQYRAVATNLDIQAVGTIMSGFSPPLIGAPTLTLLSLNGNIGFSADGPLQASTTSVTLNAPNGSVFFNNFGPAPTNVTAQTVGALNTFRITSDGDINTAGGITARDIFLQTNGDLLGVTGTLTGTNSVSLVSDASLPSSVPFTIASPNVNLRSLNGDVGTSAGTPFNLVAGVRSANLIADKGSVFVQNSETNLKNTINIRGFADDTFDFISTSPVLVGGNVTTNTGNVRIQLSGTGKLTVGTGVTVSSGKDLLLRVQAPTASAKKSIIQLNKDSTLLTTSFFPNGDIDLQVGTVGPLVPGVPPKKFINFLAHGASINWGQVAPKTKGPVNTVFAKSASVNFNNPLKNKNITLGGGVNISAGTP